MFIQNFFRQLNPVDLLNRFSIPICFLVLSTCFSLILVHYDYETSRELVSVQKTISTLIIGAFLFLSLYLVRERKLISPKLFNLKAVILIGIMNYYYFIALPSDFIIDKIFNSTVLPIWHILAFLSILVFPFLIRGKNETGFWNFSRDMIINAAISIFFSGILMGGLALAYHSIELLFKVDLGSNIYSYTSVILFQLVAPVSFLARIDKKLPDQIKIDYSRVEKWLWLYIALPLLSLYALIILTYVGKILITQVWPEGTVSYLIFAFMTGSILVNAGISPLVWDKNNSHLNIISRILWILNILFSPVLFLALNMRLQDYGLTEARYFGFLAGAWILGISILYLWKKNLNLKWSIFSLWVVLLLSIFGPWSTSNLSFHNQLNLLKQNLLANNMFDSTKNSVKPSVKELDFTTRKQISGHLEYLVNKQDKEKIDSLFQTNLAKFLEEVRKDDIKDGCYEDTCLIMKKFLNLKYVSNWEDKENSNQYYSFSQSSDFVHQNLAFKHWLTGSVDNNKNSVVKFNWEFENANYELSMVGQKLIAKKDHQIIAEFDLSTNIDAVLQNGSKDLSHTEILFQNSALGIDINRLDFQKTDKGIQDISLGFTIWF